MRGFKELERLVRPNGRTALYGNEQGRCLTLNATGTGEQLFAVRGRTMPSPEDASAPGVCLRTTDGGVA